MEAGAGGGRGGGGGLRRRRVMRVAKGCRDGRCDGAAAAAAVPCRPSCPCPCPCPSWERRPACLAVHTNVGTPQLWGGPRRAVEATASLHGAKAALRCAWVRPELSEYPEKHMGRGPQAGQMACSPRAGVLSTRCSRLSGAMASAASVGESGSCLPPSSNRCSANGIPAAPRARARVGTSVPATATPAGLHGRTFPRLNQRLDSRDGHIGPAHSHKLDASASASLRQQPLLVAAAHPRGRNGRGHGVFQARRTGGVRGSPGKVDVDCPPGQRADGEPHR